MDGCYWGAQAAHECGVDVVTQSRSAIPNRLILHMGDTRVGMFALARRSLGLDHTSVNGEVAVHAHHMINAFLNDLLGEEASGHPLLLALQVHNYCSAFDYSSCEECCTHVEGMKVGALLDLPSLSSVVSMTVVPVLKGHAPRKSLK
eukprot:4652689-Amphidinium_carterae.1